MKDQTSSGLLERIVDNASAAVRALLPGVGLPKFHANASDVVVAFTIAAISVLLISVTIGAPPLAVWGGATVLAGLVLIVAGILRHDALAVCAVGLGWSIVLGQVIILAGSIVAPNAQLHVMLLVATVPPALFTLACLGAMKGAVAVLVALAPLTFFSTPTEPVPLPRYWADLPPAEQIFTSQHDLLAEQLSPVRPSDPDRTEIFILAAAGYPYERVFRREISAAGDILADLWHAKDRVIRLANSADAPLAFPLLTRTNLSNALEGLRDRMGREDILFLFMTSHGQENLFSTQFDPYIPHDLSPADLSTALSNAYSGAAIIIISACHSGSFIDALAAPDRLVLTAAASDRTSYGCNDQNEWTGWGRAFFTEALPRYVDPRLAAREAQNIAAAEEQALDLTPSQPQIAEGAEIGARIDRWIADLP